MQFMQDDLNGLCVGDDDDENAGFLCEFEWHQGWYGYYCKYCTLYLQGWEDLLESDEEPQALGERYQ